MSLKIRRVVTGLDASGRSCIALDAPFQPHTAQGEIKAIWKSDGLPARNDAAVGAGDFNFDFDIMRRGGSAFLISEFAPSEGLVGAGMHATDTLDYIVVLRGRLEIVVETGSTILEAGDVMVDRGVLHGWRAVGDENAVMAVVLLPSIPVGDGATV